MKTATALCAVIVATLTFRSILATAASSSAIIPGAQIGPVRIGMDPATVIKALGNPSESNTATTIAWNMGWGSHKLWVVFQGTYPNGHVVRIITRSPRFTTKQGVKVGMRVREALKRLGRPVDRFELSGGGRAIYRGMFIEYQSGRVEAIVIDEP